MTGLLLTLVIVLVVACLAVRDQTIFKLSKMRTDFLGLRTEVQRMDEMRVEAEQISRWVSEALSRTASRQRKAEQYCHELEDMLAEMGIEVDGISDRSDASQDAPVET